MQNTDSLIDQIEKQVALCSLGEEGITSTGLK